MKKLPYGMASFEAIREKGEYYYVDKTRFIETIEEFGGRYLIFLRPRRFGKSLFISVLDNYYNRNAAPLFDTYFGGTYIHEKPTPLKNSFPILRMNFSAVISFGTLEQIEHSFNLTVENAINAFYHFYADILGDACMKEDMRDARNATDMLKNFIAAMYLKGVDYYLLIDEYDNFANNVLIEHDDERYKKITQSGGFLRNFFTVVKSATDSNTIKRMFVTGVSPLVLSDVTSGFNIGNNVSALSSLNAMVGFTQREVDDMLNYYIAEGMIPETQRDMIQDTLKSHYNHYKFSRHASESVYNSDMVLYFFNAYHQEKEFPNDLLDVNIRTDYGKLRYFITEGNRLNGNFEVFKELLNQGETSGTLISTFSIEEQRKTGDFGKNKFRSLLYFFGLLTIKHHIYEQNYALHIPNRIIERLQWEYMRDAIADVYDVLKLDVDFLQKEFMNTAFNGQWRKLFEYILQKFYEAVSIRDFTFHEEGIKLFLLAYLNLTSLYRVHSERELNGGYCDIYMEKDFVTTDLTQFEFMVELKYIKAADKGQPIEALKAQATEQLQQYVADHHLAERHTGKAGTHPTRKQIIIVASATELLALEEV